MNVKGRVVLEEGTEDRALLILKTSIEDFLKKDKRFSKYSFNVIERARRC